MVSKASGQLFYVAASSPSKKTVDETPLKPNWLLVISNLLMMAILVFCSMECTWGKSSIADQDHFGMSIWGVYHSNARIGSEFTSYRDICDSNSLASVQRGCRRIFMIQKVMYIATILAFCLSIYCTFMLLCIAYSYSNHGADRTQRRLNMVRFTGVAVSVFIALLCTIACMTWRRMKDLDDPAFSALFFDRSSYQHGKGFYWSVFGIIYAIGSATLYTCGSYLMILPSITTCRETECV